MGFWRHNTVFIMILSSHRYLNQITISIFTYLLNVRIHQKQFQICQPIPLGIWGRKPITRFQYQLSVSFILRYVFKILCSKVTSIHSLYAPLVCLWHSFETCGCLCFILRFFSLISVDFIHYFIHSFFYSFWIGKH